MNALLLLVALGAPAVGGPSAVDPANLDARARPVALDGGEATPPALDDLESPAAADEREDAPRLGGPARPTAADDREAFSPLDGLARPVAVDAGAPRLAGPESPAAADERETAPLLDGPEGPSAERASPPPMAAEDPPRRRPREANARWARLDRLAADHRMQPPHVAALAIDFADPPIAAVYAAALTHAGLDPADLHAMRDRARWSEALPDLRFRVVRDIDRDGRTTVRFTGEQWFGDLAAVEDRTDGLQLQGELRWSPGALLHAPAALAVAREIRTAEKTRRGLLDAVTAAYFARRRALLDARVAADPAEAIDARLRVDESTATLNALTGGAFSRLPAGEEPNR
ncbi:MAG: hypothetical protein H6705_20670 [Myxococcales bacterium]|nr:hypothetical protein [Myxococcales bacterium]